MTSHPGRSSRLGVRLTWTLFAGCLVTAAFYGLMSVTTGGLREAFGLMTFVAAVSTPYLVGESWWAWRSRNMTE